MCKLSACLLICLLSVQVCGQDNFFRPMLMDGKTWVYEYHHYIDQKDAILPKDSVFFVSYTLFGDTIIDDKKYYKMYREENGNKSYYASYREERKKVYMRTHHPISPEYEKEFVVVDFEYEGLCGPGDESDYLYYDIKETIDYVCVDGYQYRRHKYYEKDKDNVLAIGVEGVGFLGHGLGHPNLYGPEPDCLCDYQIFTSCFENGKMIFSSSDFTKKGTPTAIPRLTEIKNTNTYIQEHYDLQGRKVTTPKKNGIYIKNGKKFLYKD